MVLRQIKVKTEVQKSVQECIITAYKCSGISGRSKCNNSDTSLHHFHVLQSFRTMSFYIEWKQN